MGTNWKTGSSPLLCGWRSTGRDCPERLGGLSPGRHSEAAWTWSWAACSGWPSLSRGLGPGWLGHTILPQRNGVIRFVLKSNLKVEFLTIPVFQCRVSDQQYTSMTTAISMQMRVTLQVFSLDNFFNLWNASINTESTPIMFLLNKFPDPMYTHTNQKKFPW